MIRFIKQHAGTLLTILFLLIVGILLLVNPELFSLVIIRVCGALLILLGIVDIVRYFRAEAEQAAKGQSFFTGSILLTVGLTCLLGAQNFPDVFPMLAVLYGLLQILLGFRKLQQTVDTLRLKKGNWYLYAIASLISMLFGSIIVFNPTMNLLSIWIFTAISMIVEAVFDTVVLVLTLRSGNKKEPEAAPETPAES